MVWIGVQSGNTVFDDTIRQYDGIVLVCDWPAYIDATLAALKAYPIPIVLWRFVTNPLTLPGFPATYVATCKYATFANEPDIEGPLPPYYRQAYSIWTAAGGKVVSPAYSDDSKYAPDGYTYDVYTAHCYEGVFTNYEHVLARAYSKPVWITEYARRYQQQTALIDLGPLASKSALFTWQWKAPGNQSGYDLAGIRLEAARKDNKVFIVQAGHVNTESNCDSSLRSETGAAGEREVTQAVGSALVAKLMDAGVTARLVDANFNCGPDAHLDYEGVLALHCQSDPPHESGWDIGVGGPSSDGAAAASAKLALNVAAQYEAATGLQRRQWCQGNPNVQEYYLFQSLSLNTPFALIEMGNSALDHGYLTENQYRVVDGLLNGILAFLGRATLPVPVAAEQTIIAPAPAPVPVPVNVQTPVTSDAKAKALAMISQLQTLVESLT